MKRFYRVVTKEQQPDGGFAVHLDGKPVKVPSGAGLSVPNDAMADVIVQEWAAQEGGIVPDTMPVTQILTTAQDRVGRERAAMEEAVMKYLNTDLICYRTHQPEDLADRQIEMWDPWLDWFEDLSGIRLDTTIAIFALVQEPEAHDFVRQEIGKMDDLHFGVFQLVVSLSGSLILGLAFMKGAIDRDLILKTIRIEEDYKSELYNEDVHGLAPLEEKKLEALTRDLDAAERFLKML